MKQTYFFVPLLAALSMTCVQQAQAHGYELFGHCMRQGEKMVRCTGGVDGTPLAGLRIDVLTDDDELLVRGQLDAEGTFTFETPSLPFYVLIDAKPGLAVEIDDGEIKSDPVASTQ